MTKNNAGLQHHLRAGFGTFLCVWLLVMVNVPFAAAQGGHREPPGPFEYIKGDRNTVRVQVTLGIQYHQQALDVLATAATREDFAQASALLNHSYVMLRFAVAGLEIISAKSKWVTDPMLDMATDRLWQARWLIIEARPVLDAAATWEPRNTDELARVMQRLQTSSSLIHQAADLI